VSGRSWTTDLTMENRTCNPASYNDSIVWVSSVQCICAFIALVGNSLVILSVWKFARLRTITNYFVVSLAAADLLVALNVPFYNAFYFLSDLACHKKLCLLRYLFANYASSCSAFSLLGVAVDRYVSIVHGMSYYRLMRYKLAVGYIVSVWLFFLLFALLPCMRLGDNVDYPFEFKVVVCDLAYVYSTTFILVLGGMFWACTLVTLSLYFFVFRAAWKQLKAIAAAGDVHHRVRQEARTACTMALVLTACILGYIPYFVIAGLPLMMEMKSAIVLDVKPYVICLYFGKSALNPVIYGWKAKDFRAAFREIIFSWKANDGSHA
ncbi:unnamed protein product, partial [Ixodes hexagonus]